MSNDQGNVKPFAPRRGKPGAVEKTAIAAGANTGQSEGEYIGGFDRYPCGECIHWKKAPQFGLNNGTCMRFPPSPSIVQGPGGQAAQALMRPVLPAAHEGCDEWDDESFFEDDGDGTPSEDPARSASPLIATG